MASDTGYTAPPLPPAYDAMLAIADPVAMRVALRGMTGRERSALMLYALHDGRDNAALITALAPMDPVLAPADQKRLLSLAAAGAIDEKNAAALAATGTRLAVELVPVLRLAGCCPGPGGRNERK